MTTIIRFFVTNKHFTAITTIGFLLLGILSLLSMRIQLNPDIQFPTLKLTITYPQADQETLKKMVIDPLLPLLRENDRILSSQFEIQDQHAEGTFTFSVSDDLDKQFWSLNQKLQKVSQKLPDQVQFSLEKEQLSQVLTPFVVAVTTKDKSKSYEEALSMKQQLLLLPDVSSVTVLGNTSSLWMSLDPLKVLQKQLSYRQIYRQIKDANKQVIQGTTSIGELMVPVSFKSAVSSIEGLKGISFYPPQGQPVRLSEIASFIQREDEPIRVSTLNGEPTVIMSVQLRDKANILQASTQVNQLLSGWSNSTLLYDEATEIRFHLWQLVLNLLQGLLILFVVLFLLLGFRGGVIIALLLPATVLFVIGVLNLLNQPLQQVSIAGLIISLGLLVDNAIVVTESCSKHTDSQPKDASHYIQQTALVSRPLVFATITTILAFLPIYFLNTEEGLFLKSLSLTVAVTLSVSILLALTIIPFFLSFRRKVSVSEPIGHRWLSIIRGGIYKRFLNRFIHSKQLLTLIFVVVIVVGGLVLNHIQLQLFPASEDQYGYVTLTRYSGDTNDVVQQRIETIKSIISQTVPIEYMVHTDGFGFPRVNYSMTSYGNDVDVSQLFFKIKADRSDKHGYIEQIRPLLLALPFSDAITVQEFTFNQSQRFPLTVEVSGHSDHARNQTALEIISWTRNHPDIIGVLNSTEEHHLGMAYELDQDKLYANHLSEEEVRLALQFITTGAYLMPLYTQYQQQLPVILSAEHASSKKDPLAFLYVTNTKGESFLLSELVSFHVKSYPKSLWIKDDLSTLRLQLQLKSDSDHEGVVQELSQKLMQLEQQLPVQTLLQSYQKRLSDNFMVFTRVSLFFIVLIFALLVVLFRSFLFPVVIFTALPVSFVGGLVALFVWGNPLSLFAYLGFISLAGIVINDSILLIDSYEHLRKKNRQATFLKANVIAAAESRFIPVNTTSITTILGVFPLALVPSIFQPLAIVLIGGLIVSTVVILITVPIMVYLFESQ